MAKKNNPKNIVQNFSQFAFPLVRRVMPNMMAQQLVSVQPMSMPSGAIFYANWSHIVFLPSQWYRGNAWHYIYYLQRDGEDFAGSGRMEECKLYHKFRVSAKEGFTDKGRVHKDHDTLSFKKDEIKEMLSRQDIDFAIKRENAYVVPLPSDYREGKIALRMAEKLGEALVALGDVPMPAFADLAIMVMEACGKAEEEIRCG